LQDLTQKETSQADYRISESARHLRELYPQAGEISHLSSGSGGDVFVSGDGQERIVYKVRRVDARVRPDYWFKEALTLHLLSSGGLAPRLVGFLPDTTVGARKATEDRLQLDSQTLDCLRSRLDEQTTQAFKDVQETRTDDTSVDTGVIRMQYVENDPDAYRALLANSSEVIYQ